jgi:arylformamidase
LIIDISPLITPSLAVFPGDVPFQRQVSLEFAKGHHLSLSSISTTLHLGAHADAPSHYHPEGLAIDQVNLATYVGPCQVVDMTACQNEITIADVNVYTLTTPRILFKTNSVVDFNQWQNDFCYLSPDLVDWLVTKNIQLIGIDTPSMDHSTSKDLQTHQACYRNRMAILEGLDLREVNPGVYYLVALPLKLQGAEASPIRAVLIDDFTKLV